MNVNKMLPFLLGLGIGGVIMAAFSLGRRDKVAIEYAGGEAAPIEIQGYEGLQFDEDGIQGERRNAAVRPPEFNDPEPPTPSPPLGPPEGFDWKMLKSAPEELHRAWIMNWIDQNQLPEAEKIELAVLLGRYKLECIMPLKAESKMLKEKKTIPVDRQAQLLGKRIDETDRKAIDGMLEKYQVEMGDLAELLSTEACALALDQYDRGGYEVIRTDEMNTRQTPGRSEPEGKFRWTTSFRLGEYSIMYSFDSSYYPALDAGFLALSELRKEGLREVTRYLNDVAPPASGEGGG